MSHSADPAVDRPSAWDPAACTGADTCPPRCPRFLDKPGEPLLVGVYSDELFEDVLDMYESFSSQTMGLPPATRAERIDWLTMLTDNGRNLLVHDGNRVVGHAAVVPEDNPEPELVVFVRDDYQNRGVGTELLKHVIAHTAEAGHEALTLEVTTDNRPAVAVYSTLGFTVVETRWGQYTMRLPLSTPVAIEVRRPPAARSTGVN